jgi:hypothetical protein
MSPRPTSPPSASSDSSFSRPSPVRSPGILQHAPITPSALREAHTLSGSSEEPRSLESDGARGQNSAPSDAGASSGRHPAPVEMGNGTDGNSDTERTRGPLASRRTVVNETTSLLRRPFEIVNDPAHTGPCNHGTFSPRLESPEGSILVHSENAPATYGEDGGDSSSSLLSSFFSKVGMKSQGRKVTTTSRLAEAHGIKNTTSMYVSEILSSIHVDAFAPIKYVLNLFGYIGTSRTIYPSLHGFDSIDGFIYKVISQRQSQLLPSTFQWLSLMPQISPTSHPSTDSTLLSSTRLCMPSWEAVPKWLLVQKQPAVFLWAA